MTKISDIKNILLPIYNKDGAERCGFILPNNSIEEVKNVSGTPLMAFEIAVEDIDTYTREKSCLATWHTHPKQDCNLSGLDYNMFKSWPNLYHFIIGNNGVKCFKFDSAKKAVMEADDEQDI